MEKGFAPEILGKMDDGGVDGLIFFRSKMNVVITPVVGEIGADQDDVARMKAFDMITYELCAAAFVEKYQFHFGMIMPTVVNEWVSVFPDAERLSRSLGDF